MSDEDDYNGCVDPNMWDDINTQGKLKSPGVSIGSTIVDQYTMLPYGNSQHQPSHIELD